MKKRIMIYLAVAVALVLAAGLLLTQPVLFPQSHSTPSTEHASPSLLKKHVTTLSEKFVPRDESHPENLNKAADYIRREWENAGALVTEQPYRANRDTYRNMIARFGPADGPRILVGAHYDACEDAPGADDNASGTAGLLELARLLKSKPPTTPVELVAYSTEEPPYFRSPLMGSAVHAKRISSPHTIRFMVCLEMIGYFSDARGSQGYPMPLLRLFYPSRGNFILVVGQMNAGPLVRQVKRALAQASTLPVRSITAPSFIQGIDFSDHRNYWAAGILTDTAAHLDYPRMAQVIDGVFNLITSPQ